MLSILSRICAVALISTFANTAVAKPRVSEKTTYYSISGTTAAQLKTEMRRKGPNGAWAWTKWYVRWTGRCKTSVQITYTYPKWTNKKQAPEALQKSWDRMISKLQLHEKGHAQHGINAAKEIEKSRCQGKPISIINKWAQQDKTYDRQTQSGVTQGVVLP